MSISSSASRPMKFHMRKIKLAKSRKPKQISHFTWILTHLQSAYPDVASEPGFKDQILDHCNRLPSQYITYLKSERVGDALVHMSLLFLVRNSDAGIGFDVQLLQSSLVPDSISSDFSPRSPPRHTHQITFSSESNPRLHAKLASLLAEVGLNILETRAFATTDGYMLNIFVVDGWPCKEPKLLKTALQREVLKLKKQVSANSTLNPMGSLEQCTVQQEPIAVEMPQDGSDGLEIDFQHLKLIEEVSCCPFGDMYKGTYCGQNVTIKVLEEGDADMELLFAKEILIMRKIQHKNIVRFIGASTKPPRLCIITEYMPQGSLHDYLHKEKRVLKLSFIIKAALDVSSGMKYLHECDIVHRDLKTANLLMDEHNVVKIVDFGVARFEAQSGVMTAETGTYRWMAPEVLEHKPYDHKADVYSFGIVLWELLTGKLPYDHLTPLEAAIAVVDEGLRPIIPDNVPPKLGALIERCWHSNPALRPEFSEIKDVLQLTTMEMDAEGKTGTSSNIHKGKKTSVAIRTELLVVPAIPASSLEEHEAHRSAKFDDRTGSSITWSSEAMFSNLEQPLAAFVQNDLKAEQEQIDEISIPMEISTEDRSDDEMLDKVRGRQSDKESVNMMDTIMENLRSFGVYKVRIYGRLDEETSTLKDSFQYHPELRGLFDCIIWVPLSDTMSLNDLQKEISRQIPCTPIEDDHSDSSLSLLSLLEGVRFLLILENVPENLNFSVVGIPDQAPENGSKVILLPRPGKASHSLEVDVNITFEDQLLWGLFCENVGEVLSLPVILPLAREVVQTCRSNLDCTILMARALREVSDVSVWNDALEMLTEAALLDTLIEDVMEFATGSLPDDTSWKCFYICTLLFEDQAAFDSELLIWHWSRFGLISMHSKGEAVLNSLMDAALLESVEGGQLIKFRRIYRETLKHSIIVPEESRAFLMLGGMALTEPPVESEWKDAKEINLMDNEISYLPNSPQCPRLTVLFLQGNRKLRKIPNSFFDYMPTLQVLNLSRTSIRSLPDSLFRLPCLKKLFLNNCNLIMELPAKIGELKCLEILDLEGTKIVYVPEEVKYLTNLTSLEVTLYQHPRPPKKSGMVIPCSVISALSNLEELNIDVQPGNEHWSECAGAIIKEIRSLTRLNKLKFYFPSVESLRDFRCCGLSMESPSFLSFKFIVGSNDPRIMTRLPCDAELELDQWDRCLKFVKGEDIPEDIRQVLRHATSFFLDRHGTAKAMLDFGVENMQQLKCCVLGECNKLQTIIGSGATTSQSIFPSLEYLYIYYMKSLRSLHQGPAVRCFHSLKFLALKTCPGLTTLFTLDLLCNLGSLEELRVEDCPMIKSLVSCDDVPVDQYKPYQFLPSLRKMTIQFMPELVTVSCGLRFAPKLERLTVYDCPKLRSILFVTESLEKIEGETGWWEALEWGGSCPGYLDKVFHQIHL